MTRSIDVCGTRLNRRRFITIVAAASGAGALPRFAFGREPQTFAWRGVALGAQASLTLQHPDEAESKAAIDACLAEVARLEAILSLHRPDSALSRLNAAGRLDGAPADLRVLLTEALALAARSNGAFDPTIQPLWALYARHFATIGALADGPPEREIADARALIGWRKVSIVDATIHLEAGMALTLNGIAQGYITDRVGDLLKTRGFEHVLVNMGEQLALGPRWDGSAWTVGIADPRSPDRVIEHVALAGGAVATSAGYGCRFDRAGRFTHIIDPRTGGPARHWASVTVLADRATLADGLSTAFAAGRDSAAPEFISGKARVYAVPMGSLKGHWL